MVDSDKRTNKAIEQKRPPTPTLPLQYDPETETFRAARFPSAWRYTALAAGVSWICPAGNYQVFVYLKASRALLLNSIRLAYNATGTDMWFPLFCATVWHNQIIGEIGTPGLGDTSLDVSLSTSSTVCTAIEGWNLSGGDILSLPAVPAASWGVRYRRIS